ncbi:MAG: tripeptide aminopeptidase PepT, partial [Clostridia bacterium]|nr:tripeptide aminopeptidase PepT [Clostridia bacterium]
DLFDVPGFGADFAYTVDGGAVGGISYENFNAASGLVTVHGRSVHPGSAKNIMRNAALIAMEFAAMLPPQDRPEHTEGREGFFHLNAMQGQEELATLNYIIRDHDRARFDARKAQFRAIADYLNGKYGADTVDVDIRDSYYNMRELIEKRMEVVERANAAYRAVGVEPWSEPIRGGTDGARLTFMGLPTPNIATGGMNCHGRFECVAIEDMDLMTEMLVQLICD